MTDGKETKSKYGALIQKAREQENQKFVKPDNQTDREAENSNENSNIQEVSQNKDQKSTKPDSQITSQPEAVKEREVNLCVKVPESLRRHWAAESKRQGVTMTEVIVQALEARFGRPE